MGNKTVLIIIGVVLIVFSTIVGFFTFPFIAWMFNIHNFLALLIAGSLILTCINTFFLWAVYRISFSSAQKKVKVYFFVGISILSYFIISYATIFSIIGFGRQIESIKVKGDYFQADSNLYSKFGKCIIYECNETYDVTASTETGVPIFVGCTKTSRYGSFENEGYADYLFRYYDTSGNFIGSREIRIGYSEGDAEDCDTYVEKNPYDAAKQLVKELDGISM